MVMQSFPLLLTPQGSLNGFGGFRAAAGIIIIMEICNAPSLWLKALNKHTHIMCIEMENVISKKGFKRNFAKDARTHTHTHTQTHTLKARPGPEWKAIASCNPFTKSPCGQQPEPGATSPNLRQKIEFSCHPTA